MKPEISVIIPVYNVEPYLRKCLDSVINQSMEEIEILLIDDGSTDGSGAICDEYSKNSNKIKVFHQKNGGISFARNIGLKNAQGKYVMFVDSDDFVEKDFCRIPYLLAIKYNADLVVFCYRSVLNNHERLKNYNSTIENGIITKQQLIDNLHGVVCNSVWNKIYKKSLFENISFPNVKCREDVYTLCRLVVKANTIVFHNRVLYNYVKTVNSISSSPSLKWKFESIKAFHYQMIFLIKSGYNYTVSKHSLMRALGYLIYFGTNSDLSNKSIEMIKNYDFNSDSLDKKNRLLLFLVLNHIKMFDFLCVITNKRGNIKKYLL